MHVEASGPECRAEQSRAQNNYGGRWGMGKGLARAQKPADTYRRQHRASGRACGKALSISGLQIWESIHRV